VPEFYGDDEGSEINRDPNGNRVPKALKKICYELRGIMPKSDKLLEDMADG